MGKGGEKAEIREDLAAKDPPSPGYGATNTRTSKEGKAKGREEKTWSHAKLRLRLATARQARRHEEGVLRRPQRAQGRSQKKTKPHGGRSLKIQVFQVSRPEKGRISGEAAKEHKERKAEARKRQNLTLSSAFAWLRRDKREDTKKNKNESAFSECKEKPY